MTQGRDGTSLAPTGARRLVGLARSLSVVAAMLVIAALVAGTAATSYAKSKKNTGDGVGLFDTVVVSNGGSIFGGSLETFSEGSPHNAVPLYRALGNNTLLQGPGPSAAAVSSIDGEIAVALPTDIAAVSNTLLGPPWGCGPFGLPSTAPLYGTGLVELFGRVANGNLQADNWICSPNFAIGSDGEGSEEGFPNTSGIFVPEGVAWENPFDGTTPAGHEILAVANAFPEVFEPDSGEGGCASAPAVLGTITEYDRNELTTGLNNIVPYQNNIVGAINPFPATGRPKINPPVGVIYEQNSTIGGCLSLTAGPRNLTFDEEGFLFVVNNAPPLNKTLAALPHFITVYPPGQYGDVFPVAIIGFAGTGTGGDLNQPIGVSVATAGFEEDLLFVSDAATNSIQVFEPFTNPDPTLGFIDTGTLIATIGPGGITKLRNPQGLALSEDADTLYVVNNIKDSLLMFTDVLDIIDGGGVVPPTLEIQGPHPKMNYPSDVALPGYPELASPSSTSTPDESVAR